jgi:hypothetical protein
VIAGHAELRKNKDSDKVRRAVELTTDYMKSTLGTDFTPETKTDMRKLEDTFHAFARETLIHF